MDAPLVSVVIPAYRRPGVLRKALRSLFHQDLGPERYEIVVVDSSPDDENALVVKKLIDEASCRLSFYRKRAEGPGASRNFGAERSRGRFIAFMDSDCEASPEWLREGLASFADDVGLVQGKTLPDPAGRPGVFTWFVHNESEGFVYECANIVYRRAAFEEVGGFSREYDDPRLFPMGGEDLDLAWRVKRRGWTSRFAPRAVVYHEVAPISVLQWIFIRKLLLWPLLIRRFPEIRRFFYAGYFWDRGHAALVLALLGGALAQAFPPAAALCLPYVVVRGSEPSKTLKGPLRAVRVLAYLPRDLCSLAILIAGSVRYRCVML